MDHAEKKQLDQERASSRRRQVLGAAASCFSRSGFHGASMAEISKAAGMSAGHIYNYFDGKDAIIAAFVDDNVARIALLLGDLAQRERVLQALFDNIARYVEYNLDPAHWVLQLEIYSEAARNPAIAAVLHQADRRSRTQLREILERGRQEHGLTLDDVTLDSRTDAIIALFQGLSLRALHHPGLDVAALTAAVRLALAPLLFG